MSIAEDLKLLLEQATGNGSTGNGGNGNGGATNGDGGKPTNGNGDMNGKDKPPEGEFHHHVLRGYGPYYCSCDKDTPPHRRCPNCKTRS